jgi:glycosyltransferase involved in cell wall biosynthesis
MNKKFSVIIPLFNKGPHIARAVKSILKQTLQEFEIIVVDDHSSDEGPAVVRSFDDPRITLIEQDHRGASYTRNHGVRVATTDFIALLDADDEWMPRHLETILRLVEKYPEAGMFTTAYKIQNAEGKIHWGYKCIPDAPWEGLLPDYFRSCTLGNYPVNASNVVIPKKIFHEMGGFPESYWYGEDADLFGKIALKYPVAFSWKFGAIYHVDASNRACEKDHPRNYEEPFVKTARAALLKGEVRPDRIESVNEFITRKEMHRVYCNLDDGNLKTAESILKQCTTKLSAHEKKKLLVLIKLKLLMQAKLPFPVYLFLQNSRQNLMKMIRKK